MQGSRCQSIEQIHKRRLSFDRKLESDVSWALGQWEGDAYTSSRRGSDPSAPKRSQKPSETSSHQTTWYALLGAPSLSSPLSDSMSRQWWVHPELLALGEEGLEDVELEGLQGIL